MKKKNENIKIVICIFSFCVVTTIVLFLDYGNILNFVSKNFNYDFLGIFIPNFVLIFIFTITYLLIDKRNMEKDEKTNKNRQDILDLMLLKTYNACKDGIRLIINNSEIMEKYIIPKIKQTTKDGKSIIDNQKDFPFAYDEQIMKMAYDGFVDSKIINNYLEIKKLYMNYVDMRITFYDIEKNNSVEGEALKETIEEDNENLNQMLNNELKRLTIEKRR